MYSHWPVDALHESSVQAIPSSQVTGVPATQVPLTQVSEPLQELPSSQSLLVEQGPSSCSGTSPVGTTQAPLVLTCSYILLETRYGSVDLVPSTSPLLTHVVPLVRCPPSDAAMLL